MAIKVANNQSLTAITALPSAVSGGAMTLLETQTASSSSTISFTSNIDSTYKEYIFKYMNIHPATDGASFTFQTDTGTNTSYNQSVTTSFFQAIHAEGDGSEEVSYNTGNDLAQSSSFQILTENISSDNDHGVSGTLHLFEPSSTTFVKHFIANPQYTSASNLCMQTFVAGYFNTTTAITRLRFKMSSGDIDAGTFKLYGVV